MKNFVALMWMATHALSGVSIVMASCVGALLIVGSNNAIHQAALAAMLCAALMTIYCLTRAADSVLTVVAKWYFERDSRADVSEVKKPMSTNAATASAQARQAARNGT